MELIAELYEPVGDAIFQFLLKKKDGAELKEIFGHLAHQYKKGMTDAARATLFQGLHWRQYRRLHNGRITFPWALEAEERQQKHASYLLSNSMDEAKAPTEEEMEAYRMKRQREEDRMSQFM